VASVLPFLKKYNFDGINMAWVFPPRPDEVDKVKNQGGPPPGKFSPFLIVLNFRSFILLLCAEFFFFVTDDENLLNGKIRNEGEVQKGNPYIPTSVPS
jgi:Chitinase